jgi:hypothetical protein
MLSSSFPINWFTYYSVPFWVANHWEKKQSKLYSTVKLVNVLWGVKSLDHIQNVAIT